MLSSWAEQVDGCCYQGARLLEANDECTEDEAESGQVLLLLLLERYGAVVGGMDVRCGRLVGLGRL